MAGSPHIHATLEKPIRQATAYSGKKTITGYESVGDYWISVQPLSAREVNIARAANLEISHRVKCWWFPELKSDMRWRWQEADGTDRILAIDSLINSEEADFEWAMECYETKRA